MIPDYSGNSTSLNRFFKLIALSETTFVLNGHHNWVAVSNEYALSVTFTWNLVCVLIKLAEIKEFRIEF